MRNFLIASLGMLVLGPPALTQRASRAPEPYALTGVRVTYDEDAPRFSLLLKGGRIEALLPESQTISGEYRVLAAENLYAVPAFLDLFSFAGFDMPEPKIDQDVPIDTGSDVRIEMRMANRKGIQPEWMAASALAPTQDQREAHRQSGFGGVVCAPHGEILSGISAAVLLGDGAPRDEILAETVFGHAAFAASGRGYPGTLMGMHAQFRQFFLDAAWQGELRDRQRRGFAGPRPVYDPSLRAGEALLQGEQLLLCEAQSAADIRRWMALADEFRLKIAIVGGREAWRVADELAEKSIPVVLTLQWDKEAPDPDATEASEDSEKPGSEGGDAAEGAKKSEGAGGEEGAAKDVDPWKYEEPLALKRERRRRWELQRDNGIRLQEAGVAVFFGSGSESAKDLLDQARKLVEAGYPREAMLNALTHDAAHWIDLDSELGSLRPGTGANVTLWTGDPFDKKSKVRFSFVDGFLQSWDVSEPKAPEAGSDLSGTWKLTFVESEQSGQLILKMSEAGMLSGTAHVNFAGVSYEFPVSGQLSGKGFSLKGELQTSEWNVPVEFSATLDGDGFEGTAEVIHPGSTMKWTLKGRRQPQGERS